MTRTWKHLLLAATVASAVRWSPTVAAQTPLELASPLTLAEVMRLAATRRDEISAARARVLAGEARPTIVSALTDPMLSPSLDHLPFMGGGADASVTIEQQFPLSSIRQHRRSGALADLERLRAEENRTGLDVVLQAATSFLMLQERRQTQALLAEQVAFARDVVTAANARYAAGTAPQSDVLRAEVEVARLEAQARALDSEVRGAEGMLATSLALDAETAIPSLAPPTLDRPLPAWPAIKSALAERPEIRAGKAEIARAETEVQVMRDMFRPMAVVRSGLSYTMTDGKGWMAMVGLSLPIRRAKLHAGVAEAQAMKAMSEADLRAMTRMIEGEATVAVARVQAADDRRRALTDNVLPRARLAIAPAVAGYTAGQLPLVSVIEAIQALWLTQGDLIAANVELGLAWVRLGRAIGSYQEVLR